MNDLSDNITERTQLNITLKPGNRKKLEAIKFYEDKDLPTRILEKRIENGNRIIPNEIRYLKKCKGGSYLSVYSLEDIPFLMKCVYVDKIALLVDCCRGGRGGREDRGDREGGDATQYSILERTNEKHQDPNRRRGNKNHPSEKRATIRLRIPQDGFARHKRRPLHPRAGL